MFLTSETSTIGFYYKRIIGVVKSYLTVNRLNHGSSFTEINNCIKLSLNVSLFIFLDSNLVQYENYPQMSCDENKCEDNYIKKKINKINEFMWKFQKNVKIKNAFKSENPEINIVMKWEFCSNG